MNGRSPIIHFDLQLSEPYIYMAKSWNPAGDTEEHEVTSSRNITLDIITTSAQKAIELALGKHPNGTVHVVQRRGSTNLLFDPDIVKELVSE